MIELDGHMPYLYFQLANCIRKIYNIGDTWILRSKIYLLKYTEGINPHKCSLHHHKKELAFETTIQSCFLILYYQC